MARPPSNLESFLALQLGRYRRQGVQGLHLLDAVLKGWQAHRHFVSGDKDDFAARFFKSFAKHAGGTPNTGWLQPILDAGGDPWERFDALYESFRVPPEPEPQLKPKMIQPGDVSVMDWFLFVRDNPNARPGDGSLNALRDVYETYTPAEGVFDPFLPLFQFYLERFMIYKARYSHNTIAAPAHLRGWDARIFEIDPMKEPYRVFYSLCSELWVTNHADGREDSSADQLMPDPGYPPTIRMPAP